MQENEIIAPKPSLSMYFNASRLRTDAWDRLKRATRNLGASARRGDDMTARSEEIARLLGTLEPLESYYAFPGSRTFRELKRVLGLKDFAELERHIAWILRLLVSDAYRTRRPAVHASFARPEEESDEIEESEIHAPRDTRPYFEVLVVDDLTEHQEVELRERLLGFRKDDDEFVYDIVVAPSFEDALIAVLLNYNIQTCVIRYGFPLRSRNRLELVQRMVAGLESGSLDQEADSELGFTLAGAIRHLRPELDQFLVTDAPVEDVAGRISRRFRRVFYRQEDYLELHLSILKGIRERYSTPFFSALKNYSQRPTGVFHALPISRGKSISKSHWVRDMAHFYGMNIFNAETSATTGGLDSLLQPHGPLKEAQHHAARAFRARRSYFVTNGTSTANKIVMQALVRPGDIVLVSRDCHKSHHYALVLAGAQPVYMDPYPLARYSIYGAVALEEIKRQLLSLRSEGKLDRVRMLLLTNCTFDGLTYNVERVMEEVLAIKPDMIFVWDEAWYAFAGFTPISRRRTAMDVAARLRERLKSEDYRRAYETWKETSGVDGTDDEAWLRNRLLPDPRTTRVRVYSTQSTHKTLTSLRQGSMIHVHDQDFEQEVHVAFDDAYMTHTSTSPNYQILASLDVGRRQVEFEGYELVQQSIELGLTLRERINTHPLLSKYFRVLGPRELIPEEYRPSGFETYQDVRTDWARMDESWEGDEFCLDPTRLTLYIGRTGIDGDTFKNRLMEDHDIQINKTSRNTVLFMTHIGTTRGAIAYLIDVLTQIAQELEEKHEDENVVDRQMHEKAVYGLTEQLPPLPNFSGFHPAFKADAGKTIEGDLRGAFFLAYEEDNCEYLKLDGSVQGAMESGRTMVSAGFITPYPPGFPVLVPGQIISSEILSFLKAIDVKEIHGYEEAYGLRVFTEVSLAGALSSKEK